MILMILNFPEKSSYNLNFRYVLMKILQFLSSQIDLILMPKSDIEPFVIIIDDIDSLIPIHFRKIFQSNLILNKIYACIK